MKKVWHTAGAVACMFAVLLAGSGCGDTPQQPQPSGAGTQAPAAAASADAATDAEIARLTREGVDPAEARAGFTKILAAPDLSAERRQAALLGRAATCETLEQWPAALADYEAVLANPKTPPDRVEQALRGRAYIARIQERWPAARGDYDTILAMPTLTADERAQILARRAVIFCVTGDKEKALADYTAAEKTAGISPATRVDAGRLHAQGLVILNDLEGGLKIYADTLALPGLTAERQYTVLLERGQVYAHHEKPQEAVADFTAAAAIPTITPAKKAWALYTRGLTELDLETVGPAPGTTGEAAALADFAAVLDMPDAPASVKTQVLMERALVYLGTQKYAAANADVTEVIKAPSSSSDDRARVLGIRAACAMARSDADAALAALTEAIALPGLTPDIKHHTLIRRSELHANAHRLPEAVADCTTVIAATDADEDALAEALLERAGLYASDKKYTEAEADLQRVTRLMKTDVTNRRSAVLQLAGLYESRDMPEKALPLYSAVIDTKDTPAPDLFHALDARGTIYLQSGKSEQALQDYATIATHSAASPELIRAARFERMQVFIQLRTFEAALKESDLALGIPGEPAQVAGLQFFHGKILAELGRAKEGIENFRAYLKAVGDEGDSDGEYALALALVDDAQRDAAIAMYRTALKHDGNKKVLDQAELDHLEALKMAHADRAEDVDAVLKAVGVAAE